MKRKEKQTSSQKPSLRLLLPISFMAFTALGLLMFFAFQVFFIDDLYEYIKITAIESAATEITSCVETDALEETADYWHIKEECQVYVGVIQDGRHYESIFVSAAESDISPERWQHYYAQAKLNGGTYCEYEEVMLNKRLSPPLKKERLTPGKFDPGPPQNPVEEYESSERFVYAYTHLGESGTEYLTVISAMLTPVSATVRTLRVQFLIAAVVLITLAGALAVLISKMIGAPIISLNNKAKYLGTKHYEPSGDGVYREVRELDTTLASVSLELQKNEQLQKEWIANVSHDLRTPLTMIMGYSEAIRDLPDENTSENIQVVIDEAQRLTKLVNDVLDLSKLQSGAQSIEVAPMDLTAMVEDVCERCRRMVMADGYRLVFRHDVHVTVRVDDVRISQAIYNLLCNALAHTGEDREVIVEQTVTDSCVRLSFKDSGEGIPPDELDKIWNRYYQVHSDEQRCRSMSSGLGLSIVHTVVRLHEGVCGVDSTLGVGSTFWFELPLVDRK